MASIQTNWEDEENNRRVELDVEFQLVDGRVEIAGVTPTRISFHNGNSAAAHRTLRVWTRTGRAILARQAEVAGHLRELQDDLEARAKVQLATKGGPVTAEELCPLSA